MHDIIVIGAGPAGMTAALYALRAGKSVLLLEKSTFGGQVTYSPKIENYPGFAQLSGMELADRLTEQVLAQGADIEPARVIGVERDNRLFKVVTEDGFFTAKAVVIAVGVRHRLLGLEGESELIGNGISFCAVCDGAFYADKTVAVIGGGNSALQEAILLSETSKKVYVVQNLAFLTGEERLQDILKSRDNVEIILSATVKAVKGSAELEAIVLDTEGGESTLDVDGMFLAIGLVPENDVFASLTRLENGYIAADESCTTGTDGIYVAGDCRTKAVRQITTATADGATAALAACRYIDREAAL